jgi:Flp pilus assembly protein TadG
MPASAVSTPLTRIFRRFGRDDSGSAAVDFSLVAVPFFALFFAIVESALVFFAGQVLETAVQDSARPIFTHQLQDSGLNAAQQEQQFKTDLCNRVAVLMSCSSGGVEYDVKYYAAGTAINLTDPITNGAYDNTGFGFVAPPAGSTGTLVVRAYYQWPLIVTGLGYNIANINRTGPNSKRLLAATVAFHIEP